MDARAVIALQREGRWAEAEQVCSRGLAERPDDDAALHLLGGIALRHGDSARAVELMTRAVGLAPGNPYHRIDLAAALGQTGRAADAVAHLEVALLARPDLPELHNNFGVTLEKLGRLPEAAAAYRRAIDLRPVYPEAYHNLGNSLRKMGQAARSAAAYRQAVRLKPDYLKAVQGLAGTLGETGESEQVLACLGDLVRRLPRSAAARGALLYTLHYSAEQDAATLAREHRDWGALFCDPLCGSIRPHENDRDSERKLRIGYVSPDLREHTVTKFISAAIEHHDREQFEVCCYSDAEMPDAVTERLKGWAEHWRDTRGQSDDAMEKFIRADRIDILVDLRGHAADNRLLLFCRKPAPVQINMVGYFNTTGLSAMDYRLTDAHMDPIGMTEHLNCETLIRLEPSCWCYSPEPPVASGVEPGAPEVAEPPCIRNGYVTFGSLNKIVKVSEPCAKLWARVLDAAPNSRLLLSAAGDAAPAVRQRLAAMGLPPERVDLVDKTRTSREYLERFRQIDIALDTFPFNGITTTCDGLWMGVPCVSLAGGTSVSRAGASILHAANLPELATTTPEQFVKAAAELAGDITRLKSLRLGMRQRLAGSALLDHRAFARKLESAYRHMWRAWCDQPSIAAARPGVPRPEPSSAASSRSG